jgi:hypothetical protein
MQIQKLCSHPNRKKKLMSNIAYVATDGRTSVLSCNSTVCKNAAKQIPPDACVFDETVYVFYSKMLTLQNPERRATHLFVPYREAVIYVLDKHTSLSETPCTSLRWR